jgi:uncharacterized integral membrane protein
LLYLLLLLLLIIKTTYIPILFFKTRFDWPPTLLATFASGVSIVGLPLKD